MDRRTHTRERRRQREAQSEIGYVQIAFFAAMAFGATWFALPQVQSLYATGTMSPEERAAIEASVHYPGCDQVRAQGNAPLYRGQPGYREGMDGDGDGIACETHW